MACDYMKIIRPNIPTCIMNLLLVEDNSADAHMLMEFLAEQGGGSTVHRVADGYEALDYVYRRGKYEHAERPDLILLDLGLPRISGYQVLKELKTQRPFASIMIVILTASRNPLDRKQCAALGADSFLSKPHNIQEYEVLAHQLATLGFPRLR